MASGNTTTTNTATSMKKLQTLLKKTKYIGEFNTENLTIGKSEAYVPIYYHLLYKFSQVIADRVSGHGKLFARNDARFFQGLIRVLKDAFNFVPKLTKEEFLQTGFAERKIMTCIEVMQLLYNIHINETKPTHQDQRVTVRAQKSNVRQLQRHSMMPSTSASSLQKELQWPRFKNVEEPAHCSTPKEGFIATADGQSCPQPLSGSTQSLFNLACEAPRQAIKNENGTSSSNLQADVDALKIQVEGLTKRLDEITTFVYSPVNVLPVLRPRRDESCEDEFR